MLRHYLTCNYLHGAANSRHFLPRLQHLPPKRGIAAMRSISTRRPDPSLYGREGRCSLSGIEGDEKPPLAIISEGVSFQSICRIGIFGTYLIYLSGA